MKKTIILLPFLLLFCMCGNAQLKDPQQTLPKDNTKKNVIMIDKEGFLKNVYNFEKNPNKWVYEGTLPCIVDFYADWCGPCRMIAPIMEELATEYKGKIVIYKVDTQKSPELSQIFSIRSIPTLFFCPMGEQAQAVQGALPKEQFKQLIETVLLKNEQAKK